MIVHGNGSIEQLDKSRPRSRCRKWRLWASTDQGRKSKRFDGTYTEACNALRDFVEGLKCQITSTEVFGPYAESWALWRRSSGNFAPNTLANDRRDLNALKRTEIWGMKLTDITPQDCRDALTDVREHPVRASRLSNKSMAKIHGTLAMITAQAHRDGMCAADPMDGIAPPKVKRVERDAFSPSELREVIEQLGNLPLDGRTMACYLMAYLGLRRGEACALLDSDVANGFCTVHRAVKERDGSTGDPKSKAGFRVLPVPHGLQEKVDEWRELRASQGFADAPTLCNNTRGGTLRPQNLQKWWDIHRGEFGCDGFTTHQLRHSNLSMMARHMSPFDLQRYAGWSSLAPAKIYIHDDMDSVARAVADAW